MKKGVSLAKLQNHMGITCEMVRDLNMASLLSCNAAQLIYGVHLGRRGIISGVHILQPACGATSYSFPTLSEVENMM